MENSNFFPWRKVNFLKRSRKTVRHMQCICGVKWGGCILLFFNYCFMNGMLSVITSCFKWLTPQWNQWTLGNLLTYIIYLLKRQKWIWPLGLNPSLKAYCVHSLTFTLPSAPIPPSSSLYGKWHSSGLIYTHTPRGKKGLFSEPESENSI